MVRNNRGAERGEGTENSDERFRTALEKHYRTDDPWRYLPAHVVRSSARSAINGSTRQLTSRRPVLQWPGATLHSLIRAVWTTRGVRSQVPTGVRLAATLALVAVLSTGVVLAASTIFNLGKPTNNVSTNQYFPLSGFHYVKGLQPAGKARVLFIGTLSGHDVNSPAERWPLVKALQQFGAFSHLKAYDRVCYQDPQAKRTLCTDPSFDWSHAAYRSAYLHFQARELMRNSHTPPSQYNFLPSEPYQRMNGTELALYKRFVHVPLAPQQHYDPYNVFLALMKQQLPLIVIGNYLEQGPSQILHNADLEEQVPPGGPLPTPNTTGVSNVTYYNSGLAFAQIQQALQTQTDPKGSTLVEDVNAEANIMTALICRADGKKPARVCGRSVISSLLRHIR